MMSKPTHFKTLEGKIIPLPVFFPDATRAVLKTLDSVDIKNTKTPGILVNTYHLFRELGIRVIDKHGGVSKFMNWDGGIISDSGGFQVMSVAKNHSGRSAITDEGVKFQLPGEKKLILTPAKSVEFQMSLKTDMVVVLDDFTPARAAREEAEDTVRRTLLWAQKSKDAFQEECKKRGYTEKNRPYLLGVVQGGDYLDLREECTKKLVEIGFDGLGYGGWPITEEGFFNYAVAKTIADNAPDNYLLYGLGVGKPHEVAALTRMGYTIFDCVLPTRDARHGRLYVYNAASREKINLEDEKFWSFFSPDKQKYYTDTEPVSRACDCLLCTNYSRAYLSHLFRIKDTTAMRLSTIHNLRFYSILMEKLRAEEEKLSTHSKPKTAII